MIVLDHLKCNLLMEKKKPQIYYKGEKVENVNAVIPRIGASVTFYGTAVVRHFEMMKVFSTVESGAILRSRDKLRSYRFFLVRVSDCQKRHLPTSRATPSD